MTDLDRMRAKLQPTKGEVCPDCSDSGVTQDGPHNVFCACPAGRRIASVWASMPTKGEGG